MRIKINGHNTNHKNFTNIVAVLAFILTLVASVIISIQDADARDTKQKANHDEQKLNQQNKCKNNATCTNIGSNDLIIYSSTRNITNKDELPNLNNNPDPEYAPLFLPFP